MGGPAGGENREKKSKIKSWRRRCRQMFSIYGKKMMFFLILISGAKYICRFFLFFSTKNEKKRIFKQIEPFYHHAAGQGDCILTRYERAT